MDTAYRDFTPNPLPNPVVPAVLSIYLVRLFCATSGCATLELVANCLDSLATLARNDMRAYTDDVLFARASNTSQDLDTAHNLIRRHNDDATATAC